MNVLRKFNNILKKTLHFDDGDDEKTTAEENGVDYYHKKVDPLKNTKTSPPQDEKIRIPALWAFEVYTPSYIAHLHDGVCKLGWSQDDWSVSSGFQDALNELRYRASGSGWINLGYIIDETKETWWPGTKKAKLPDGIESIRASILQFLPSTTILACMFILKDDLANSIENPLKNIYSTYKEKIKNGYRIIDVLRQKKDAVVLARESLKNLCTSWLAENFPGLFSSGYLDGNFPVCELITFEKHAPFQRIHAKSYDSFLSMLHLAHNFNAWQSDELEGIFLQLPEGKNSRINNLVLAGNINNMLANKDLKGYGETTEDKILNYLNYIDKSLGKWVLLVIAKTFERRLTKLRDSYGEHDIDNLNKSASVLMNLDRQMLDIQKNAVPFINELKGFCKHETYFMHDVFEFKAIHDMRKTDDGLFTSIRKRLLFYADLLNRNEKLLRNTADANRQLAAAKSSTYLAQTNIGLQKRMNLMTLVILLLMIVSAVSAILEIKKTFDLTVLFEWVNRLLK